MKPLENKIALVTGAARGIGQAIALQLAADGADLALCDVKAEWLDDTVAKVKADVIAVDFRRKAHLYPSFEPMAMLVYAAQGSDVSMTMVDGRTNNAKSIIAALRSTLGGSVRVFDTEIPRSVRAAEASGEGKSIFAFDPKSRVAQAYTNLTKEVAELGKETNRSRSDGAR